jgi:hypothetical protein
MSEQLPPLPQGYEPHELPLDYYGPLWIESQLRAYAAAAVQAERERCADICEQHASIEGIAQRCAAAIRGMT